MSPVNPQAPPAPGTLEPPRVPPYDRLGSGEPPILLVPGVTGHRRWMAPLARALAPRHLTLALTLPGEPEAPARGPHPRQAGLDEVVDSMAALLDSCGLEKAVVCGTSFGGMAALRFALDHPDRTQALVLHATSARPVLPLRRWRRILPYRLLAVLVFNLVLLSEFPAEFRASCPDPRARRRCWRRTARMRLTTPWSARAVWWRLQVIRELDMTPRLGEIRVPTLVLSGEARLDRIMPPGEGEWIAARVAAARHRVLGGTGHMGMLFRPDLAAIEIESFLAAVLPAGR